MKTNLLKKLCLIVFVLIQTTMSVAQNEASISLGNCQFIQANRKIATNDRFIKMSISNKWQSIPDRIINHAGGVAFVQTAKPAESFKVNEFSLYCDTMENKAYAVINGIRYAIPLDVWQLQPIVAYANGTKNVAVTLFGAEPAPVRFHPAFVDKLLGLRLLQMDLLLDGHYVQTLDEMCGLPSFNGGDIILGPNERYDSDQCDKSMDALVEIRSIINSKKSTYTSYIYTDFQQDIILDTLHGELTLSGEPYYRFTTTDTLRTYRKMQKALNSWWNSFGPDYAKTLKTNYPLLASVRNVSMKKISDLQKAQRVSFIVDSIRNKGNNRLSGFPVFYSSDEIRLINLWDTNKVNKQLKELTDYLRENDSIVYYLNPTVVEASHLTCRWTAFFRYAKTKVGARNWNTFRDQVKRMKYDADIVYTPINLKYNKVGNRLKRIRSGWNSVYPFED